MNSTKLLLAVILAVGCLTQVASDIYTPSIPAIAHALQTPINHVQWTMAVYLLGVAITQLIYGPVSEGIGRRKPILFGLSIMLIGSVVCVFAPTIKFLLLGRFIQGCGAGACATLWRSMFRDAFEGAQLAKYSSYLVMLVSFVLPAAPAIGGYLQEFIGWRANFSFIALYVAVTLLLVFTRLHETSKHHHKERLNRKFIFDSYKQLLTSPIFMGYSVAVFLCYGAYFATFVVSPVLIIHIVGLRPVTFGWLSLIISTSSMLIGGILNSRYLDKLGSHFMMRMGWVLMILSGILLLLGKYFIGINAYVIMGPIALFYFGGIFIWTNVFANAFQPFGKIAGYTGAMYGFMQLGGGAVSGALVSHLSDHDQVPLALLMLCAPVLSWVIFEVIVKPAEIMTGVKSSHD